MIYETHKYISKEASDLRSAQKVGQVVILGDGEACAKASSFDPNRIITFLISETEKALSEGYKALRVIIEPVCWKENDFDRITDGPSTVQD